MKIYQNKQWALDKFITTDYVPEKFFPSVQAKQSNVTMQALGYIWVKGDFTYMQQQQQ